MPGFTPGRRFQPPTSRSAAGRRERALAFVERRIKGALFGCRMCGNCLLQETAFICPMECPKGLRNGPCGGSTPGRLLRRPDAGRASGTASTSAPSAWAARDRLMEVLPPLDWSRVGRETWLEVAPQGPRPRARRSALRSLVGGRANARAFWDPLFREIRQPWWWSGDDQPHPAPPHQPVSTLEEKLAAGQFVVTSEVAPPLSVAPDELIRTLNLLRDYIDAANFTDNPSATPRMSSLACSAIALAQGVEPVMQIAARDRTRMGLQAEILGAAALGIRNVLCLTGDHPKQGPGAARPHGHLGPRLDPDAVDPAAHARREDVPRRPRRSRNPPRLFLGAAASPSASTPAHPGAARTEEVARRRAVLPEQPGLRRRALRALPGRARQGRRAGAHAVPRRHHAGAQRARGAGHDAGAGHPDPAGPDRSAGAVVGPAGRGRADRARDHRARPAPAGRARRPHHGRRLGADRAAPGARGRPQGAAGAAGRAGGRGAARSDRSEPRGARRRAPAAGRVHRPPVPRRPGREGPGLRRRHGHRAAAARAHRRRLRRRALRRAATTTSSLQKPEVDRGASTRRTSTPAATSSRPARSARTG